MVVQISHTPLKPSRDLDLSQLPECVTCATDATDKMPDLNAASLESAMSMIEGTARSMGITVEE